MKLKFAYYKQGAAKPSTKTIDSPVFDLGVNEYNLAKYVRVVLSNNRQNTAQTKDRGEVSGGGKKPWRQKGTGRARHGSSRSPIWTGGGVTFGPSTDRNYKRRVNKREKLLAFSTIVTNRVESNELGLIDIPELKKTSDFAKLLSSVMDADSSDANVIIITTNSAVVRYARNMPNVESIHAGEVSAYDLMRGSKILIDAADIDSIISRKESQLQK